MKSQLTNIVSPKEAYIQATKEMLDAFFANDKERFLTAIPKWDQAAEAAEEYERTDWYPRRWNSHGVPCSVNPAPEGPPYASHS